MHLPRSKMLLLLFCLLNFVLAFPISNALYIFKHETLLKIRHMVVITFNGISDVSHLGYSTRIACRYSLRQCLPFRIKHVFHRIIDVVKNVFVACGHFISLAYTLNKKARNTLYNNPFCIF